VSDRERNHRFRMSVLVHLDAGYNLARWLLRDPDIAEDAVQQACLRAYRRFDQMQGTNSKAWFLAIVRNVTLDALKARRRHGIVEPYDDDLHGVAGSATSVGVEQPEDALIRNAEAEWVHRCIAALPDDYREVLVLREVEELSYKEIATLVGVPIGTVMSRLSRARDVLQGRLIGHRTRSTK
jgi:RNA polymerase sigma factor (sigma-70 family)